MDKIEARRELLKRYLLPVSKHPNGADKFEIRDSDDKVITEVSKEYRLINNYEIVNPLLERFGEPDRVARIRNAHAYVFEFFTKREFDLGDGDIIKEKLVVRNSYDKSKAFSFFYGALRMVCTNGLYTSCGMAIEYRKIHTGEIPVHEVIQQALGSFQKNNFDFWRKLKSVPLTLRREENIVREWTPFITENLIDIDLVEKKNREIVNETLRLIKLPESLNNQRNGWGLFNQMNYAVAGKYKANGMTNKRILGDRRSENYLAMKLKIKEVV